MADYLNNIKPDDAPKDAKQLAKLFKQVTGAKMWGSSVVGYDEYTYYRSNGDEGQSKASGFSIRKSALPNNIMPRYQDYQPSLSQIGPHKLGKSCLYLKNLQGINLEALAELITQGITDLQKSHAVQL